MASIPTLEEESDRSTPEFSKSTLAITPKRKRELEDAVERYKRCKSSVGSIAEEFVCPILTELPVDPVTAEDGRIYERSEIERLIQMQGNYLRSPITNRRMGPRLTDAVQVRNSIKILVDSGAVEGNLAKHWKQRVLVEETKKKAEGGNTEAMYDLGSWYFHGKNGLPEDDEQAYKWHKKGADLHSPKCMAQAGRLLIHGWGVDKNVAYGLVLTSMAAYAGSDVACYKMGTYYNYGLHGFPQDYNQTKHWFRKVVDGSASVKHLSESLRNRAQHNFRVLNSET